MDRRFHIRIRFALTILIISFVIAFSLQHLVSQPPEAAIPSGQGRPWMNYAAPREIAPDAILQEESALPLSLTAADFDGNGKQDIAIGYVSAQGGMVIIHSDAFAGDRLLFEVSERPDYLEAGDFDRDGIVDLFVAARGGSSVLILQRNSSGEWRSESLSLSGTITAAASGDVFTRDGLTDLVFAVRSPKGPQILIYGGIKGTSAEEPESYSLPAEVSAFAFGDLEGKSSVNIAAATGNEILILRGKNESIDRIQLSFAAASMAIGNFVFDRGARNEIAVLAQDGSVQILNRSSLDRRPFTEQEQLWMKQNRKKLSPEDFAAFLRSLNKEGGIGGWEIYDGVNSIGGYTFGASGVLVAARVSGMPTEDIVVASRSTGKVEVLVNSGDGRMLGRLKGEQTFATESIAQASLNVGGAPIAVLPVLLNVDTKPDFVVLREGQLAPITIISAPMAVIDVDSTADVIANGDGCTVREAIINANNDNQSGSTDCAAGSGADQINVPAGTYTLTIGPFDDESSSLGAVETSGDLDILNDDLTIVGAGSASTIIQAGTTNANGIDRVFDINNIDGPDVPLSFALNDVTVRFGNAPEPSGFFERGGGIQFNGFDPLLPGPSNAITLNNVVVDQNTAAGFGGGVLAVFGTLDVNSSTISTNDSVHASGGGIHYDGGASANGQLLDISNSTIASNFTSDTTSGSGAGIRTGGGVSVTIADTNITLNQAASNGGGIAVENSPVVSITGGSISSNEAKTDGGGIWSNAFDPFGNTPSTFGLTSVPVNSNKADSDANGTGDGGGILNLRGTMTFTNGSIDSNTAVNGGGVFNSLLDVPPTFNRAGGTLLSNSATLNGGAIAAIAGTIDLNGTTLNSNDADSDTNGSGDGGGIFNNGATITIAATTIGNNFAINDARNGGGIANALGTLNITSTLFGANNATASGGHLAVNDGTVTLNGVTLEDSAAGANGGAISIDGGTLTLNAPLTMQRNHANNGFGGAIFRSGGTLILSGNITIGGNVSGDANTANDGAGIANMSGSLSMDGARISFNTATGDGGGILNSGTLTLTNMKMHNNSATNGGAISNSAGSTNVSLSRFFGNSGTGSAIAQTGGTVIAENNWWGCDGFPGSAGCDTTTGTVDSDPRVDLQLSAAPPAIAPNGTSTLTADVTHNTNGASLGVLSALEGLNVAFTSGPLGSVSPGGGAISSGTASTTFTAGSATGEAFPSVTLDNGTQNVSVWIADTDCSLSPLDDVNQINTNHTVTVTVVNGATPLSATSVDFDVTSGPNTGDGTTQTTDGSGQASFTYTGDGGLGIDAIQASGNPTFNGIPFPYNCAAQKEWVNAQGILAPATDTNQILTQHTVTLTLTLNGNPVSSVPVSFNVTAGPNVGANGNGNTDTNGQVSFTYTGGSTTGTDTIQASGVVTVRGFGVPFVATATKEWVNVAASLTPSFDVNQINTAHTVTATVTLNGAPQSGVTVNFNVTSGPNAGDNGTGTTNGSGQANFTWTGDSGIGTDTVQAAGTVTVNSVAIPFNATAQKEWANIQFSMSPSSDTNPVNTSHTVTATLLVNGVAQQGVDVNFNISSGPNSGESGTDTTNASGQATFNWLGDGGIGVDTLQAFGNVIISGISVPFNATATKEWVDVQCSLAPPTDVNQIGTTHNLVATVTNGGNPLAFVTVDFNVIGGPNTGTSGSDDTDVNGNALFNYAGSGGIGTDTIQGSGNAVINSLPFPFSCTASKQWVNVQATLTPTLDVNQINTQHTVTVTVLLDGAPAQGVSVNFNVTSGPNAGEAGAGTTNASGQATFTYTGDSGTGTDTIQASGNVIVNSVPIPFNATAQKQWVDVQATLAPLTDVNQLNTPHTVTATITVNGSPTSGVTVNFNVTAGPNTGDNGTDTTDGSGQADFTYTGDGGVGTDTIQASGSVIISGVPVPFSATATKQWVLVMATLTPSTDVNPLNTQHTVTATILADGSPAQGVTVNFDVIAGPNTGDSGSGVTDVNGQTTFTYTGDGGIGIDTIQASGTVIVNSVPVPFSVTAQKRWVVVTASLAPSTDTNPVNTAHTVTATVTLDGGPSQGTTVNFNVTAGPNAGDNGSATTDSNGQAQFTYTGDGGIGVDTIQATGNVIVDGVPIAFSASATKEWVDVQCVLNPPTDTNPVGTNHTVTVTVTNGPNPLSGLLVSFNVTAGPNTGDNGSGTTDGSGQTSFTYTGDGGFGTDTIQASGTAVINSLPFPFSCTAQKEWAQAAATLTPSSDVNQINTQHTVTATITLNGSPVPGVLVNFNVTAGPNVGDAGSGTTDGAGQTSFTYTGDGGIGTDTIQASGNVIVNGVPIPFLTTAQKQWVDVQAVLNPPTATNQIGATHTVTVTLTLNGAPVSGNAIDFNVTSGPNSGDNGSGTTDGSGEASFTYTGDGGVGTDTIQASGTVSVSGVPIPFSATAQKQWIDLQCTLNPPTGSAQPGDQYTVTFTVTVDGSPQAGVPVNFSVTSGPNTGTTGSGITDVAGQTVFTYTGSGGPGVDVIEATGTFNSVAVQCTATVTWCLFCDEFDDGQLDPNWTYLKGTWTEDGQNLIGSNARAAIAIATPVFQGCSICHVEATMLTTGGLFNKAWLLAWYVSKQNTIELLMKEEADRWVFKQKSGGIMVAKQSVGLQIDPNVFYTVRIEFDGQNFQVFINGALQMTIPAVVQPSGTVGFKAKKTTAQFGRILVE